MPGPPDPPPPVSAPLDWSNVAARAVDAWGDGEGRAWAEASAGRSRARQAVPVAPAGLRAEGQLGLTAQEQGLVAVELPLGTGAAERRVWRTEGAWWDAEADLAQDSFARAVIDDWARWWLAAHLAQDLRAHADQVEADLARLGEAVTAGALSAAALDDLVAEHVWLRAEAWAHDAAAAEAEASLRRSLGAAELPEVERIEPPEVAAANPWRDLAVTDGPVAAAASAQAAMSDAAAARRRDRPSIDVGPMVARDGAGELRPFAFVAVRVPLGAAARPERLAERSDAEAAREQASWAAVQWARSLEGEAATWDLAVRRLAHLRQDVMAPLAARVARTEAAFEAGHVTADRLVRARREAHEAEHETWTLTADLLARRARAHWVAASADDGGAR